MGVGPDTARRRWTRKKQTPSPHRLVRSSAMSRRRSTCSPISSRTRSSVTCIGSSTETCGRGQVGTERVISISASIPSASPSSSAGRSITSGTGGSTPTTGQHGSSASSCTPRSFESTASSTGTGERRVCSLTWCSPLCKTRRRSQRRTTGRSTSASTSPCCVSTTSPENYGELHQFGALLGRARRLSVVLGSVQVPQQFRNPRFAGGFRVVPRRGW